ncbi:hypothetical protein ACGFY7_44765 [Streptomyces prunicolor]|uniref:hypothetical protein n=1 Tax=Streptomyces prunicolor TaxID=67348 RepID=UPI003720EFAA
MSDNFLTVIPTDPYWQPGRAAAHHAKAALSALLPDADTRRGFAAATWHDTVEAVPCGTDSGPWWGDAVQERYAVPCCGTETSLNDLTYDWPMGFASFRIEALHPNRDRLTDQDPTSATTAAGHPLRQILAHF